LANNVSNSIITVDSAEITKNESETESTTTTSQANSDVSNEYSQTNNQVENVDEADIVKTDGKNIYYAQNGRVYIVEASSLELKAEIRDIDEGFYPSEIFINDNKLIVLGSIYYNKTFGNSIDTAIDELKDYAAAKSKAVVRIYDVSYIQNYIQNLLTF
jgi:uncharacterized secreted protein with C-terminal beta-propeller domain